MMTIFLLQIVCAEQNIQPVRQNTCINLTQTCADCSFVNFTSVYDSSHNKVLENTQATKDGTLFYTPFCNTNKTGMYIVNGVGDVEGTNTVFAYKFDVNTNGNATNYDIMSLMVLFIFLIIISIAFTIWFWIIKHPIMYMFLILTFIFITVLCFFGYKATEFISVGIQNVMYAIYWTSLILTFLLFFVVLIDVTIKLFQAFARRRNKGYMEQF
jgi:hypothetical protein